jgi:hypothetical protein
VPLAVVRCDVPRLLHHVPHRGLGKVEGIIAATASGGLGKVAAAARR